MYNLIIRAQNLKGLAERRVGCTWFDFDFYTATERVELIIACVYTFDEDSVVQDGYF